MTTAELDQLRALARAATPGPWRVEAQGHAEQDVARVNNLEVAPPDSVELAHCADDAAYIAAVSPDVVLDLIDEVLTSRRRIGALTTLTDAQTARLQSYMNDGAKRAEAINTLASEREANALLTDEIEQLRADKRELTAQLRYIRTHLYAATVQRSPADDRIIADHIEQAYLRANEVIAEMEKAND